MSDGHDQAPLWTPTAETMASARMTDFMSWVGDRHGRSFADYAELWQWSVDELEQFWGDIWEYCGVRASKPYEHVLASKAMPSAPWFEGAQLNYAENMLTRERDPRATALLYASELRPLAELSWGELSEQVAAVAGGLRSLGVHGTAAMVGTLSGPDRYPSAAFTTLAPGASAFGQVRVAAAGTTNYDPNALRWGDYSWAVLDPSGTSFWMATEYVPPKSSQTTDGLTNWGTRVLDVSAG